MFSRLPRNHARDRVSGGSVTVTHDFERWNAILTRGLRKRAGRREGATARGALIGNSQLAIMHTLPETLDVFEAHGVNAIALWPVNFSGSSSTPEAFERDETTDVGGVGGSLRERGFVVACVTLGFHVAPLCTPSETVLALEIDER